MSEDERILVTRLWLHHADDDRRLADALIADPQSTPRHICWLAQQCTEKTLKAALIFLQREFPYRHDLDVLRNLLPDDWMVKEVVPDLAELTEWAVEARYPGDWPEATRADALSAMAQAQTVVTAILTDLARSGLRSQGHQQEGRPATGISISVAGQQPTDQRQPDATGVMIAPAVWNMEQRPFQRYEEPGAANTRLPCSLPI